MRFFDKYSLLWAEFFLILLGLVAVRFVPPRAFAVFGSLRTLAMRIARRPRNAIALSFAMPIVLRLLSWRFQRVPTPTIQDEFSYLLLADTFAHGRLTNPPHPLWIHFDTIHVLQHPTYASIYPVMQGLFLAAGQVLLHNPWLGVWLSVALMCAAFCWALQAWLPPFWALAGAALAAVRLGMFSYWINSDWGGVAAALGGALVLGALPRVLRRQRMRDAVILAAGIAILANSRPFEGFVFCVPVAVVLIAWILGAEKFCRRCALRFGRRPSFGKLAARVVTPLASALVLAAILMGYYFWRVTGDPLTMPYVAEARQYEVTPLFLWQKVRPAPSYSDDRLRYFFADWSPKPVPEGKRAFYGWAFYLGPILTIPLLMLPLVARDRRTRFPLLVCVVMIPPLALEWWWNPHYAAPATLALYVLILQGLRHLRCANRHARWRSLAALVPAVVLAMIAVRIALPYLQRPVKPEVPSTWASMGPPFNLRYQVERQLQQIGGQHLVLVRYQNHNRVPAIHNEWVYNAADIDHAPIVWARELDAAHNRELLAYFKNRQVWLVDPDATPPALRPWVPASSR